MKTERVKEIVKEYYWVILLILVFSAAFYLRGIPGTKLEYPKLQAIDPYFMYRMGEDIVEGRGIPTSDYLAQWGTVEGGPDRTRDSILTFYAYPIVYFMLSPFSSSFVVFGVSNLWYWTAIWGPAFFGALQVLLMYFLGKELFNRKVGLLAAAFLAFVPGILYRVSAGFIEKEPVGGMFMLLTFLFFVKAFKVGGIDRAVSWRHVLFHPLSVIHKTKLNEERVRTVKTILYGVLAGVSLLLMSLSWGGTKIVLIVIPFFVLVSILLNRYDHRFFLSYMSFFVSFTLLVIFFGYSGLAVPAVNLQGVEMLVNYLIAGMMLIRFGVERFGLVEEKYVPYVLPVLFVVGLFVFGVASYVNVELGEWTGRMIVMTSQPISSGVIASTVAESQTAGGFMQDSLTTFGTGYSIAVLRWPQPTLYLSAVYFAWIGLFLMLYEFVFRRRKKEFLFASVFFVMSFILAMGAVRLNFIFAFPLALAAAYCLVRGGEFVISRTRNLKGRLPLYVKVGVGVFMGLVVVSNFASGWVMANSIGTSMDNSWYQAIIWLRDNTAEDAVLLEWWDYGWWFHYVGKKITLVDGGYHPQKPTQDIAQFYTTPISERSLNFLKKYEVDYVMVSPDLISKFGAMSKIANWGKKIDVLPVFNFAGQYQQGDKTLIEFKLGDQSILVAYSTITSGNTTGMGNITALIKTSQGQAYIRDIGMGDQVIRNERENSIPGMVYIAGDAVVYIPEAVEECMFVRLYLFNGAGLENYFEKVYDNLGMKIYRVAYENFPEEITGEYVDAIDLENAS
jgi:asparagine N-glycosylation enzyme membrane subunit Stt3